MSISTKALSLFGYVKRNIPLRIPAVISAFTP